MAVTVPGQCGNAVAERQTQCVQSVGDPARTLGSVFVGVAVDVTLHPARNNFCVAVVAFSKNDQIRNQQRLALH